MNRYKLTQAGVNPRDGIERFSGNKDLFEKYLNAFPQDPNFEKLKEGLKSKNIESAFQAAHALKGVSGNLSLEELFERIVPLVEELRAGSMEHADELMVPIEESYQKVVEALQDNES